MLTVRRNHERKKVILQYCFIASVSGYYNNILVDFINMESKADQETLLTLLKEQLWKDPIQTVFVDLTKLGLIEITRKKTAASLAEKLGRSRKETL